MSRRAWTLEAAREMMADVRSRTARAVEEVESMLARREEPSLPAEEIAELERKIDVRFSLWVREMEALGVEVKGAWLVDFDSGAGYFCWKWPEEELAFFHGYDEGFAGRARIQ